MVKAVPALVRGAGRLVGWGRRRWRKRGEGWWMVWRGWGGWDEGVRRAWGRRWTVRLVDVGEGGREEERERLLG